MYNIQLALNLGWCSFVAVVVLDIVYIIGGDCDNTDGPFLTYEVITVDLNTGEVSEAGDMIYAVGFPGSASSLNRIAVCGGVLGTRMVSACQLYSPTSKRCVRVCLKLVHTFTL